MSFQGALARLPQEEILVAENVFQSNDNQRKGHTQNLPQPSRLPTATANIASFVWPLLMVP